MERADLIAAVLTGMRRAEDFRAQGALYSTAHSEQMQVDHGKAADAELVLSMFAFTPNTSSCLAPPASKTWAKSFATRGP